MWTELESTYRHAIGRCKRTLAIAFVFGLFINLFQFVIPIYMMQMFDRVLPSSSMDTLIYLTIIAVFALFIMMLMEIVRSRLLSRTGAWFEEYLSKSAFESAIAAALERKNYHSDATRDLFIIRSFLSGGGMNALLDAPLVPIFLAVCYLLHPIFGIIATGGAVVMFGFAILNEKATNKPMMDSSEAGREAHRRIAAATRHPEAIDAMGMLRGVANRWYDANAKSLEYHTVASERSSIISSCSKFIRMMIQVSVLGAGAILVMQQEMTPGVTIAVSMIIGRALAPLEQSIGVWKSLLQVRDSLSKLKTLFSEVKVRDKGMELPTPTGQLSVEGVNYLLPGAGSYLLRNVSFDIEPGEVVVITGPSTAGKSTLARMVMGTLKPTSGTVRLDGADVYDWDRNQFGRYVGYLPQDIELYGGTVRENIGRMEDADWGETVIAAKMANCHEMILRMPNGYDSQIGEDGVSLSGGQRQRIGLARAIFGNPKLVVLDEPDSDLDMDGEQALTEAIRELKARGTTVILVAHRSTILRVVDKILILREGQVELFGPRDEVLAKLRGGRTQPALEKPKTADPSKLVRPQVAAVSAAKQQARDAEVSDAPARPSGDGAASGETDPRQVAPTSVKRQPEKPPQAQDPEKPVIDWRKARANRDSDQSRMLPFRNKPKPVMSRADD